MKAFVLQTGRLALFTIMVVLFSSHELFLKTDAYFLKEYMTSELYLFNGTFDGSENAITTDRIIGARIIGPEYEFLPGPKDYYDKDKATFLKFTTGNEGTYVAGISTLPRSIELSAIDFREYLDHEGLEKTIDERIKKGINEKPAKEKYSKHVKSLLQVSEETTEDYNRVFGYPIEFVPLVNPYELKVGQKIRFKLLLHGEPIENQVVHYSSRNDGVDPFVKEKTTRTNAVGELEFEITETGDWYVASIYMVESNEKDYDYESNWATLSFGVK